MNRRILAAPLFLICLLLLSAARPAVAFVPDDRWITTASGPTGLDGDPITLTWSFVGDGTQLVGEGPSDLIDFLDTNLGTGSGGTDLTQRPWFELFDDAFSRWTELGGITYVYEPNDDGVLQGSSSSNSRGLLGVRGDIRIGGAWIDGPSGTLAFNHLPDNGDMVLDTGDDAFYSHPASNYRRLRNTVMHEAGHGFGLNHVESNTSGFLLEPRISWSFDGPQFDDIRGLQWFYGDALEKTNNGQGNDTSANATDLGLIAPGNSVSIGTDAADTFVSPTDTDFISIDRNTDIDFFSLTVSEPSLLDVVLTPLGPTYNQAAEGGTQSPIDTSAISNLALDIFDIDGTTLLASANNTGAGFAEMLTDISLPAAGEYFVRITGDDEIIQFYQLDLAVEAPTYLAADFNQDGMVDGDDFDAWQASFAVNSGGDADSDGDTDGLDFLIWQLQFGTSLGAASSSTAAIYESSTTAIPEPSTALLVLLAGLTAPLTLGRLSK